MKLRDPSGYAAWRTEWKKLRAKQLLLDISHRATNVANHPNRAFMLEGFLERFPEVTHEAMARQRALQWSIRTRLITRLT